MVHSYKPGKTKELKDKTAADVASWFFYTLNLNRSIFTSMYNSEKKASQGIQTLLVTLILVDLTFHENL